MIVSLVFKVQWHCQGGQTVRESARRTGHQGAVLGLLVGDGHGQQPRIQVAISRLVSLRREPSKVDAHWQAPPSGAALGTVPAAECDSDSDVNSTLNFLWTAVLQLVYNQERPAPSDPSCSCLKQTGSIRAGPGRAVYYATVVVSVCVLATHFRLSSGLVQFLSE
jgi:hypothetical protein